MAERQLAEYRAQAGLYVEQITRDAGPPDWDTVPSCEYCIDGDPCIGQCDPYGGGGYDQPTPVDLGPPMMNVPFAVGVPGTGSYDQPTGATPKPEVDELSVQLATMFREIFYQYTNRVGRSTQQTLGPSEIGTPCDRRLVMHMLGAPHVNPGGDGWAAWVGTQIHLGLDKMMEWADAGQGRFATEMKLRFANSLVPKGTLDLLDRILFMVDDHKAMGSWSRDKLRQNGPTPLYRVQLHVYAYGAVQRGEKVDKVALVIWPRDESSLEELFVWWEPYNPVIALEAFARVDELKAWSDKMTADGSTPVEVAQAASIEKDCRYCAYYMPKARDLSHGGCNGRR